MSDGDGNVGVGSTPGSTRVRIFDTTLRDGEQAPGIALIAGREGRDRRAARAAERGHPRGGVPDLLRRRVRRGVGDRVQRSGTGDRGARAHHDRRHRARGAGPEGRGALADPHLHQHQRHPDERHAQDVEQPGARRDPRERHAGRELHRRRRVQCPGRHAHRARVPARVLPRGGDGGRHHDQRARHRGLRHAHGVRRAGPDRARGHPRSCGDLHALPQRPRPRRRELARRHRERGRSGRGGRQRDRRASRELLARGDRDDPAHARRGAGSASRIGAARDHAHVPPRVA